MRIGAGTESLKFFLKQSLMSGGGVEKAKMKGKKKPTLFIYLFMLYSLKEYLLRALLITHILGSE